MSYFLTINKAIISINAKKIRHKKIANSKRNKFRSQERKKSKFVRINFALIKTLRVCQKKRSQIMTNTRMEVNLLQIVKVTTQTLIKTSQNREIMENKKTISQSHIYSSSMTKYFSWRFSEVFSKVSILKQTLRWGEL